MDANAAGGAVLYEYIAWGYGQILFVLAQSMFDHFLLLDMQLALMDIRTTFFKKFACAFCIASLRVIPIYAVDYLFFFGTGNVFGLTIYIMFLFINPVAAVIYFLVLKKVLNLSIPRTNLLVHNHILMHNIVALCFISINSMFHYFFGTIVITEGFYLGDVFGIIVMMILLFACWIAFKRFVHKRKKYMIISPNYSENKVKDILVTFLMISTFYAALVIYGNIGWEIHWETNGSAMVIDQKLINFIFAGSILLALVCNMQRIRINLLEWGIQATETYISSLLRANQEFRGLRHDFYNVLQTYGGYLALGDYAALNRFHQSLFQTTKTADDRLALLEALKPRIAVYGLLEAKMQKAGQKGVVFAISQICDITGVVLNDLDFCRVLSIVLDNAIEAAEDSEGKQVNLSIERRTPNSMVFTISNTTRGEVDIRAALDEGHSTKPGHAGIGLPQALHILNAYEHCMLRLSCHGNQFTLFLLLHTDPAAQAEPGPEARPEAEV